MQITWKGFLYVMLIGIVGKYTLNQATCKTLCYEQTHKFDFATQAGSVLFKITFFWINFSMYNKAFILKTHASKLYNQKV